MKLTGIKVTNDGTLQVSWLQSTEDGCAAAWRCTGALRTPNALAEALQAIVPLAADVIGIAPHIQSQCAFAAITIKEDKDDERNSYVRITLQAPSASEKPAEAKTSKMATISVIGKDEQGKDVLRAGAMSAAMLHKFNQIVRLGHDYVKKACEMEPLG